MNPDITVIIPTYNRAEILVQTIALVKKNMIYDQGEIRFLIGVDGDDDTVDRLRGVENVRMLKGPKNGLGANLNMLIQVADTELLFQMDDDHHLVRPLDVNAHANNLLKRQEMGWIRLMFGWCREWSGYYHFSGRLHGTYWQLIPNEGELYIPSNRPHLKVKAFHTKHYGLYTPGLTLGGTEADFCHHFAQYWSQNEMPGVFMPMYPPPESTWMHVGETWQHTEHDK